jgi:hypothetical protein
VKNERKKLEVKSPLHLKNIKLTAANHGWARLPHQETPTNWNNFSKEPHEISKSTS